MKNETLGTILLVVIWTAFFMGMLSIDNQTLFMIDGFAIMIFGTWTGIRLRKK